MIDSRVRDDRYGSTVPHDTTPGRFDRGVAGPAQAPEDSLSGIATTLREFREARDWQAFHTPRNLAVSIAIECGELLEHFQWVEDHAAPGQTTEIADELADVAIYVIQLAESLQISLPAAIANKIEGNADRYPVELSRGSAVKHSRLRVRRAS